MNSVLRSLKQNLGHKAASAQQISISSSFPSLLCLGPRAPSSPMSMSCVTFRPRHLRARALEGCFHFPLLQSPWPHVTAFRRRNDKMEEGSTIYARRRNKPWMHKTTEVLGLLSCNDAHVMSLLPSLITNPVTNGKWQMRAEGEGHF